MARFSISDFVRRMVSKLKDLTRRSVDQEGEPVEEQGAAAGWDSHTSSGWEPSGDQEAETGWDSHAAVLPGDAGYVEVVKKRDSGYASLEEELATSALGDIAANRVKYAQLPFKTKHYFLTHVQKTLEDTCVRYARAHLRRYLADPEWKKANLLFPSGEYQAERLVSKDWLAEDEIELESWMQAFASRLPVPFNRRIFESVIDLRNAAVHRGDREEMSFEDLAYAMSLPTLLGDTKGQSDISTAFGYVTNDPKLDDDTATCVKNSIYEPQPCTTAYQLLRRLQTLLEESCFQHAARHIPDVLTRHNWTMPEQIELQKWQDIFRSAYVQHDDSARVLFPTTDPSTLSYLLGGARIKIRNAVAHRLPLVPGHLTAQVHRAIAICVLQNDWARAIEVEILAEMYLAQRTRPQVLTRLECAYRVGGVESPYERERRVAIAYLLAMAEGREICAEDAVVITHTCDMSLPDFGDGAWVERTFSASMDASLKRMDGFLG